MLTALSIAGTLVVAYLAAALAQVVRLGLSPRQALLYTPLKLLYGIEDGAIARLRRTAAPVVYVVIHRSRLDPALMLSLLPDKTLHILDEASARAGWLEPFRALAPTIAFNAKHVFVSRRLVRRLKGGGSLAVYLPDDVEPDPAGFRLYRAIARIASQAEAPVMVIDIAGARMLPFSLAPAGSTPRRLLPLLSIRALEPVTIAELQRRAGERYSTRAHVLFDRVAEARVASADRQRTIFLAIRDAADRYGVNRVIFEDQSSTTASYGDLLADARLIGRRVARIGEPGSAVGLLLDGSRSAVTAFLAVQSAGRVAAVLNPSADASDMRAALVAGDIHSVLAPMALRGSPAAEAIEANGARLLWLDEIAAGMGHADRLFARLLRRHPLRRRKAEDPALLLFTAGTEGRPKAVRLSHRNVVTNVLQIRARLALPITDRLLSLLPPHHCFGLTGGIILPLQAGIRVQLVAPDAAPERVTIRQKPTILLGTDAALLRWARAELAGDPLAALRFVFTGGAPLSTATREAWRMGRGLAVQEGYGMTEMAPVVALNTTTHAREGTVGRLLPGITMRLEPVEGDETISRLLLTGPNRMLGELVPERPGELQPAAEWHDTGDLVSVDREGFLTLRGRARRLVRIGEIMVQLDDVEAMARQIAPEGEHAALTASEPDVDPAVIVVTTARDLDHETLAARMRAAGMAEAAIPARVLVTEQMPRLGSGKIDYEAAGRLLRSVADTAA